MQKSLATKLKLLAANPSHRAFILADAKDADMAFGILSPGKTAAGKLRSLSDFRDQIREITRQSLIDIMLMSASTSDLLTIKERLFDKSPITPAARANDSTDIHIPRGGRYLHAPSRPFASATIDHIQAGISPCTNAQRTRGANLGLYSVTFNNLSDHDLASLEAYKSFRLEAEAKHFHHFLEIFNPNVAPQIHGLAPNQIAPFVNDNIARMLAGVPRSSRPLFLKVAYHGPAAMEELRSYDSSLIIGIMGGAAGTHHDAFHLLHEAKNHGARAALFGRRINAAEHQLEFVEHLRRVADDDLKPAEAVKSYHAALAKHSIPPHRLLTADLQLTSHLAPNRNSYSAAAKSASRKRKGKA